MGRQVDLLPLRQSDGDYSSVGATELSSTGSKLTKQWQKKVLYEAVFFYKSR